MCEAAAGGHEKLVSYFVSQGVNDLYGGMYRAMIGGHEKLVEFFKAKLNESQF